MGPNTALTATLAQLGILAMQQNPPPVQPRQLAMQREENRRIYEQHQQANEEQTERQSNAFRAREEGAAQQSAGPWQSQPAFSYSQPALSHSHPATSLAPDEQFAIIPRGVGQALSGKCPNFIAQAGLVFNEAYCALVRAYLMLNYRQLEADPK